MAKKSDSVQLSTVAPSLNWAGTRNAGRTGTSVDITSSPTRSSINTSTSNTSSKSQVVIRQQPVASANPSFNYSPITFLVDDNTLLDEQQRRFDYPEKPLPQNVMLYEKVQDYSVTSRRPIMWS